ncbi:MAG: sodium:proton antiporter [Lachnospiraceae bacterium]|nr:sodium:proton antiporter [Lachnospiraceae bacterium]
MSVEYAYHLLFMGVLIWFAALLAACLVRTVIGPRITDRVLSVNMIGTMVISCIVVLSVMLKESYLVDVALIYAMISFISVLILASVYLPSRKVRGRIRGSVEEETETEPRGAEQIRVPEREKEERETAKAEKTGAQRAETKPGQSVKKRSSKGKKREKIVSRE